MGGVKSIPSTAAAVKKLNIYHFIERKMIEKMHTHSS